MFARRAKRSFGRRLRESILPPGGYRRAAHYLCRRIQRLSASPHAIAIGVAAGVFASFTPLIGVHFLLAIALALMLHGNVLAAMLGTAIGNPLTFPVIWASTYEIGSRLIGARSVDAPAAVPGGVPWSALDTIWPVIEPMLVGAVPLGGAAALAAYFLTRPAVAGFQAARRANLAARATPTGGPHG